MSIWKPKVLLMGDSNMQGVENLLHPMIKGEVVNTSIYGGNTAGQQAVWDAFENWEKQSFDYIVVQIGANDIAVTQTPASELIPEISVLFQSIAAGKKESCKIIASTMLPGASAALYTSEWLAVNEAYRGEGLTPFVADYYVHYHTEKVDDGNHLIKDEYDAGDGVHLTTEAREFMADDFRQVIDFVYYK
jgi:lysophospholipase L1-like esterase